MRFADATTGLLLVVRQLANLFLATTQLLRFVAIMTTAKYTHLYMSALLPPFKWQSIFCFARTSFLTNNYSILIIYNFLTQIMSLDPYSVLFYYE